MKNATPWSLSGGRRTAGAGVSIAMLSVLAAAGVPVAIHCGPYVPPRRSPTETEVQRRTRIEQEIIDAAEAKRARKAANRAR